MTTMKQEEFDLLHNEFSSMGNMVHQALVAATVATLNNDSSHIKGLIKNDKLIDGRENTIDTHCVKLWATQAPVAAELRVLFATIRSTNELERIGDHAKNIARSIQVATQHDDHLFLHKSVKKACIDTPVLLNQALDAHHTSNETLARETRALCDASKKELKSLHAAYTPIFEENRHSIAALLESLSIGQNLQRISALTSNICKNTLYMIEGDLSRHNGRENPLS